MLKQTKPKKKLSICFVLTNVPWAWGLPCVVSTTSGIPLEEIDFPFLYQYQWDFVSTGLGGVVQTPGEEQPLNSLIQPQISFLFGFEVHRKDLMSVIVNLDIGLRRTTCSYHLILFKVFSLPTFSLAHL